MQQHDEEKDAEAEEEEEEEEDMLPLLPPLPDWVPRGMYLWGGVGIGKSMLMDLFMETVRPHIYAARRVHFHSFMCEVPERIHAAKLAAANDSSIGTTSSEGDTLVEVCCRAPHCASLSLRACA